MRTSLIPLLFIEISFLFFRQSSCSVWNTPVSFQLKNQQISSLCGTVTITNPLLSSRTAYSFVLSIKTCSAKLASWHGGMDNDPTPDDPLTRYIVSDKSDQVSLIIGKATISAGRSYKVSICLWDPLKDGLSVNDLIFGVDLSDNQTPCTGSDCSLQCGDGLCPSLLASNCVIGCQPNACTRTITRKKKKKGIQPSMNVWAGSVILIETFNTPNMYCADIEVKHTNTRTAVSHVLTMEYLSGKAKMKSFDDTYDFDIVRAISDIVAYRQVANYVSYAPNINYDVGAFCLELRQNIAFNPATDMRFSVDMRDMPTNCTPKKCEQLCSSTCSGNWESMCPLDCTNSV